MPLYDYQCSACGHEMEALQKMSDPKLTTCPECQAETLTKKVTAAAFRLSGSGWYETDFKSGDKRNLTDNGSDKKAEGGSSDKKTDGDKQSTPTDAKKAPAVSKATPPPAKD